MAKLVRTVLLKRMPKSGMPSTRTLAIGVTTPVWISAAAALVTAGVTGLVAPVWSSGPNGDGLTSALQSAAPAGADCTSSDRAAIPTIAASPTVLMICPPIPILRLQGNGKRVIRMLYLGQIQHPPHRYGNADADLRGFFGTPVRKALGLAPSDTHGA